MSTVGQERRLGGVDRTSVDIRDVVTILRDRWLTVLLPVCVALLLALSYLATAPRLYTGVTSLLIDARIRPAVGDNQSAMIGSPDAVLVESQVRLISSDPVLRRVVESEGLQNDPEFVSAGRVGLRTRLFQALGLSRAAAPAHDDLVTRAVQSLAPRVVVKRSERTYIADIEVTSTDPSKAAALSNAVARAYLEDQKATRNDAAERDSDWVASQITTMQAGLQDAEQKAEQYKRDHGILNANGKPVNEQELADAVTALSQAKARVTETKARFDQIRKTIAAGRKAGSLPDALKSPAIDRLRGQLADISRQGASLRQTLGSRHPALLENEQQLRDVRQLIDEELSRVEAGLANELQTAQGTEAGLEARVASLRTTTLDSNEDHVHLDELQRDVDARRAVYDRFLRARDTVREQTVDAPIGRVISPAIAPSAPSSPRSFAVLLLAVATGLVAGIGLALLLDLFAGRRSLPALLRSRWPLRGSLPAESQHGSRFPVLGSVPSPFPAEATDARKGTRITDRLRAAWPTTVEIDRRPLDAGFLRAAERIDIGAHGLDGRSLTVAITSEGDPATRTALALALAERTALRGLRAIVIDADGGATMLGELVAPGARPALIDLGGTTRLCYRILLPGPGTLSVVPVLADESRIAGRLESRPETQRIDGFAGHFDVVIFDGPSLGRPAQLKALAASTDLLLVVAAGAQDPQALVATLELPPGCTVAAVLSDRDAASRPSEAA